MKTVALLLLLLAPAVLATTFDRIAAIVDGDVITLTEVEQRILLHLYVAQPGETAEAFRRRVLESMIAQTLRYRDVERFGAPDVSRDIIESRLREVISTFPSEEAFLQTLQEMEMTLDELRMVIKRRLQLEAYVEERFSPLIFVSLDEIERYHSEVWGPQRRARGLAVPPVADAREEIRDLLKAERLQAEIQRWSEQLRSRANVDIYIYR